MRKLLIVTVLAALALAGGSWSDGSAAAADWSSGLRPTADWSSSVSVKAPAARKSHVVSNTGWFCPTLGQVANAGGGYSYVCWSYRWFLVHREG
jgi:hypothetical protein